MTEIKANKSVLGKIEDPCANNGLIFKSSYECRMSNRFLPPTRMQAIE